MTFTRTQVVLLVAVLVIGLTMAGWWASLGRLAVAGGGSAQAMPVIAAVPAADTQAQPEAAAPSVPATAAPTAALMPQSLVSQGWLAQASVATGIPARALQAYAGAAIVIAKQQPSCHLGWNTLAAIGEQESAHGTTGGAYIDSAGQLHGVILGPVLDGGSYGKVPDTDHGALDGDATWDRAVGPMQILPATWAKYGVDANGDGKADPNQIDDAALSAARYLCAAGGDLSQASGWANAIHAYNPNDAYQQAVRASADQYAKAVG